MLQIKEALKQRGLTQNELAERLGFNPHARVGRD